MSNYNSLKTTIDANIKQNGRQEITGQILNSVLNQMVTTLGAGYQFAGVATLDPATDPGTPDAKVFYIANGKGTYTNFGGVEVTEDDVVVLYWDSSWHKVSTGIASQEKLSELDQNAEKVYLGATQSTSKISVTFNTDGGFTISVTGGVYVFGDSDRRDVITQTDSNVSNTFNGPLTDGFLYLHKLSRTSFEFAFREYVDAALSAADGYYFIGFIDVVAKKAVLTPLCAIYSENTDNFPTKGSDKPITSNGVFNGIAAKLPFFAGVNFSFDFSDLTTWKLTLTNKANYYPSLLSFKGNKIPLDSAFFTELTFNDNSFGWLWYDVVNNTFVYSNYDPASYQTYVNSENYFLVASCNPYLGEVIPYGFDAENMVISCDINRLLKLRDSVKLSPCDYLVKSPIILDNGKSLCGSFGKTRLILTDGCNTAISASNKSNIKVSDLEIVGTEPEYNTEMNGIVAGDGYNLLSIGDIYVTYPGEQHGGSVRSTPHIANIGNEIGITLYYCENVILDSLKINHINGSAIRVNHVGMNYEKGLNCSNLFITNCYNGIWTENEHEFSQYSNFTITKCQVGILISSGNLVFNGGHITKGRVGIAFIDGYNHGHGVIDCIEIKHNQLYGIYAKDCDYGECIGTASIQYSPILLDNCKGFVIGTLFFSSGSITCSNPSGYTQNNVITTILNQGGSTIEETGNLKILNQFVA